MAGGTRVVLRPPVDGLGAPVRAAGRTRRRLAVPVVLLLLLGVPGVLAMVGSGEPVLVALGLTTAALLALGCVLAVAILRGRDGRAEVVVGEGGLELPPVAVLRWAGAVGAGLALVLAGILVAGGIAGVDLGSTRFASPGVGIVLAVLVVVGVARRPPLPGRAPRLVLTPDGVGRRRVGRTELVAWDDVVEAAVVTDPAVQLVVRRRPAAPRPGARPEELLAGVRLTLPLASYGTDPRVVRALVEHYARRKGDRAELAGAEVVERLRRGDLDVRR